MKQYLTEKQNGGRLREVVAMTELTVLEWGRTFSDFWGKKILLSRDSKWSRLKSSESCLLNVTITSHYIPQPQHQY